MATGTNSTAIRQQKPSSVIIHHYNIEKQLDGMYMIQDGKRFVGPIELIEHHRQHLDGFITMPQHPCNRLPFQPPVAFRGMTYTDLENELLLKAESIKGIKIEKALGPQREHLIVMVAKDLHTKQPWYHDRISREEADKRMNKDGHVDGKFLVRQRDDKKTFALTLSYKDESRHYMIDKMNDKYGIQDGPKFDCIIMVSTVSYLKTKAD
ncbi:hypothetical protein KUTeg_016717 [Tegillarca granosa]|uniref:SH2 domain-containing protein n=1 Tax=Tegillarca granosa TaxID=220873 RepID=A0ABQ9ELN1_TEGGR|nr:hypothetical protein KUTeg_016717 [Tegillarca granosa]